MAFQDNSGDIILDAVLTDAGRRAMARGDGTFKINHFKLGDDEINYENFNLNHTGGSPYYDLEILQTSSSTITRVIEGIITIRPQVTV